MNFIKKIFEDKIDDSVKRQFTKFSQGEFEYKALLDITVMSKKVKIKTSPEFTNELVRLLGQTVDDKVQVKGIIFSTRDLKEDCEINFDKVSNAMGVKKHFVNTELTGADTIKLHDTLPFCSLNLSFTTPYGSLKVKEKPPKSSKPGNKPESKPKADYCVLTTDDKSILEDFAFDIKKDFKKAFISHTFVIEEITVPEEYKNDFAKARLHAKRKGKIIRHTEVDGEEFSTEKAFQT